MVRGAGFGHGIGMSQYGAYGFAQKGFGHERILKHYYRGTSLTDAPSRPVRVLLQASDPYVRFRGATRASGRPRAEPRQDLPGHALGRAAADPRAWARSAPRCG